MKIAPDDAILLGHAGAGVLGILAALWVLVETLNARNASESNAGRIRGAALATAFFIALAWLLGGYWYLHDYPADKAMILKGPWPFAHGVFMETKEHLFFLTLVLSLYLPVACGDNPASNRLARRMIICVAALIVLSGLGIEGAGAVINHGAKVALEQARRAGT
jgi:hypothetical protein